MQHDTTVWYGTTTEKILAWRELRQQAADKSLLETIEMINAWWTYTPWVRKTIDPYDTSTWPTPWDMINLGQFCRSAIALGQAYTLWLCRPDVKTELYLVNNFSEKDIHLIAVIDEKFVLNYILGQVLMLEQCDFELLNTVNRQDLKHIKI
jgi:hypothetical protein